MNISGHPIAQVPFDFWLATVVTILVTALVIFLLSVLFKRVKSFFKKNKEITQNEVVKHDLN